MKREDFLTRMEPLCELLDNVGAVSSKTAKIALLSSYHDEELLMNVLSYTYNPYYIYGIDKKKVFDKYCTAKTTDGDFFSVLDYLMRNNTGRDIDKRYLHAYLHGIDDEFIRSWLIKMVLKDLKIGVAIETINKVFKGLIPTFKVALCETFDEAKDLRFHNYIVQPKLDGVRIVAICQGGDCKLFTRNGMTVDGYDEIVSELSKDVWQGFVLDGEILSSNFDGTMEGLFAKEKGKVAKYHIFDILSEREFNEKKCHSSYENRWRMYLDMHRDYLTSEGVSEEQSVLQVVEGELYDRNTIINEVWKLDETARSFGYEGLVLKGTSCQYSFRRDYTWVKFKKMITDEFEIVGMKEGEGKYEGKLGALVVKDRITGVTTEVGSGFTDELREHYYDNFDIIDSSLVEVKFQEKTKDGKLRFPVFVKIRTDL